MARALYRYAPADARPRAERTTAAAVHEKLNAAIRQKTYPAEGIFPQSTAAPEETRKAAAAWRRCHQQPQYAQPGEGIRGRAWAAVDARAAFHAPGPAAAAQPQQQEGGRMGDVREEVWKEVGEWQIFGRVVDWENILNLIF